MFGEAGETWNDSANQMLQANMNVPQIVTSVCGAVVGVILALQFGLAIIVLFGIFAGWLCGRLLFPPKVIYPTGKCQHCGYDLRGSESGKCPECGKPYEEADSAGRH